MKTDGKTPAKKNTSQKNPPDYALRKMEIVAPGGQPESMRAAILAGADAVYLGLKGALGARRSATNFNLDELLEAIEFAHLRGARLYLTFNTLMTDEEIESSYETLKPLYEAGLDGIIIQDWGILRFIKDHFPDFHIHASTQMTLANYIEANYMHEKGVQRLVPARELSLEEIKSLRKQTAIELEIFVSGALCVSYSGNCYMSSFIGGRSGNRGLCAQICRKHYTNANGKEGFFLSPKDQLQGKEEIAQLGEAGVDALKLEGRMKSASYVFATVQYFRDLMEGKSPEPATMSLFNRGYAKGYFHGVTSLINPLFSGNYGHPIGTLKQNHLALTEKVILGDGLSYLDKNGKILGGDYLNKIILQGVKETPKFALPGQTITLPSLPEGTVVIHKTYSKEIIDQLDHAIKTAKRQIGIEAAFLAHTGAPMELTLSLGKTSITVSGITLSPARQNPLPPEEVKEKLSETGETTFRIDNLTLDYDQKCFIPLKELKSLKREALEKLEKAHLETFRRKALPYHSYCPLDSRASTPELAACVMYPWQEKLAREYGIKTIYHRGMDAAREGRLPEIDLHSQLARNLYQLLKNHNEKVTLDWNFNVTNSYAFREYASIPKTGTIYLSPELSFAQVKEVKGTGAKKGLVIYGYLPGMYLEQPLYEEKLVTLANDNNDKFKVYRNSFDNTEIYLDKPMNLIPRLKEILTLGLDELRMDFTFESKEEMQAVLESWQTGKGTYTPYNIERGLL
jgi:putative protease